jgi:hypothetical protein
MTAPINLIFKRAFNHSRNLNQAGDRSCKQGCEQVAA